MVKNRKIIYAIILAVLLISTAFFVYSIIINPLGDHKVIPPLAAALGFIALSREKKKLSQI